MDIVDHFLTSFEARFNVSEVRAKMHELHRSGAGMANKYSDDSSMGRNLAHGLEVAVGVGLGYLGGNWVDKRYGWTPWGLFAGVMLGCAAGMYLLVKDAIRGEKRND